MSSLHLDSGDRQALGGAHGRAHQLAMEIVVEMAEALEAPRLINIESAHIDGCLAFGQVALDLPQRLLAGHGRVSVPTTLNVSSLDLLHPERPVGDPATAALGRKIVTTYEALGCEPTWTCAPYQLPERPALGAHVAWAESNAIVFANSVLGARTSRYGDFFDICAALSGRVPEAGLHVTQHRRGEIVFRLVGLSDEQLRNDILYPVLGTLVGERAGARIPVIVGLPSDVSEAQLKALGAAAASAGSVALFHAVGVTPEASTLDVALQRQPALTQIDIEIGDLVAARGSLTGGGDAPLTAVSVGTPHFSFAEFEALRLVLAGRVVAAGVRFYASTGRGTLAELVERGWAAELEDLGVTIVTDTCTYIRPMFDMGGGTVLTNSGKWAYYAPATLGVDVVLASLTECVESAIAGRVGVSDGI